MSLRGSQHAGHVDRVTASSRPGRVRLPGQHPGLRAGRSGRARGVRRPGTAAGDGCRVVTWVRGLRARSGRGVPASWQGRVTVSAPGPCSAGHQAGPLQSRGGCSRCRRDALVAGFTAAARSLAPGQVVAAVDAAAGNGQALRSLAAARDVLADGAPPGVGRLVTELIARGSAEFTAPACKSCGTTGRPLTRSSRGGVCPGCRNRLLAVACGRCGGVKPVAVRTDAGEPVCERCRRHERGHRPCGTCRTCGKRPGQVWHDETADLGRHVFRKLSSLADAVAERDYCKRGWPTL